MKSDIILIDNQGKGFTEALKETKKVASYTGLEPKLTTRLQLMTEEMLSLARSVTGEMQASFWIENEGSQFDLHMATKTIMDKEKRYNLLSTASSRKNEAAKGFLGKLRDKLEEAMAAEVDHSEEEIPMDIIVDLANEYGYASSGESFSIADKSEAWIMELIGKGTNLRNGVNTNKGIVWVKNGADKRKVFDNAELAEMMSQCGSFAPDEAAVKDFGIKDMDEQVLKKYLLNRFAAKKGRGKF